MHAHGRGFTLLEVLVVLVLVSLLAGLLMQVFTYVLKLRGQALTALEHQRSEMLPKEWFRSVVAATESLSVGHEQAFRGTSTNMAGTTLAGLDADIGVPTQFQLSLEEQDASVQLIYRQGTAKSNWTIAEFLAINDGFRYQSADGKWHSTWPFVGKNLLEQLPTRVSLTWSDRNNDERTWLVRTSGNRRAVRAMRLFEDG